MPKPVRVLIADDHPVFRFGLKQLLEAKTGFNVVAEASSGAEAIEQAGKVSPDVVLLDLAMPKSSGLDAISELVKSPSHPKVILLTAGIENVQIAQALQLGVSAVVMKQAASEQLFDAIQTVVAGKLWMGNHSAVDLAEALQKFTALSADQRQPQYGLTQRELHIIGGVVDGYTNNEIGKKLGITERTVKNHLVTVFIKLGVSNRVELALFATQRHLLS